MTREETKNKYIYTINDLTDGEIRSIEYAYGQFIHNAVSGDFAETNGIMDAFRAKKSPQNTNKSRKVPNLMSALSSAQNSTQKLHIVQPSNSPSTSPSNSPQKSPQNTNGVS